MPVLIPDNEVTPVIRAMEANLVGHFRFDRSQLPNAYMIDSPELLLIDSGYRSDTFNIITRANLPVDTIHSHIHNAISHFRSKDYNFSWWIGPTSRPPNLEAELVACGLQKEEHEYGMTMQLSLLPDKPEGPKGLTIRRARSWQELTDFADVIAGNWEPPDPDVLPVYLSVEDLLQPDNCPMQLFVGYIDDEPVATSELFFGGGVAGLYSVSTKQTFRRQGIGAVMTWDALNTARNANVETGILQASAEGRAVYAKLGFVEQCAYAVYK